MFSMLFKSFLKDLKKVQSRRIASSLDNNLLTMIMNLHIQTHEVCTSNFQKDQV